MTNSCRAVKLRKTDHFRVTSLAIKAFQKYFNIQNQFKITLTQKFLRYKRCP